MKLFQCNTFHPNALIRNARTQQPPLFGQQRGDLRGRVVAVRGQDEHARTGSGNDGRVSGTPQFVDEFHGAPERGAALFLVQPLPGGRQQQPRLRAEGEHEQTGLAAVYSVDEYLHDIVKKHEKTRPDKEDDRTRHIIDLRAQTGPVFLTYRHQSTIDAIAARVCAGAPLYDFTAADGVGHTIWRATAADTEALAAR